MIFVLDTTAFSAAMRLDPAMIEFLRSRRPGEIATVPPVTAEIEYGIRRLDSSSRKSRLLSERKDQLLALVQVLPWEPRSSVNFGTIKADLENAGTLIDDFDIAIAAIALSHGAEVVTANLSHFRRIEGLASRHWDTNQT
jgi:tRNA(fMet)-specific endonuclease VapC